MANQRASSLFRFGSVTAESPLADLHTQVHIEAAANRHASSRSNWVGQRRPLNLSSKQWPIGVPQFRFTRSVSGDLSISHRSSGQSACLNSVSLGRSVATSCAIHHAMSDSSYHSADCHVTVNQYKKQRPIGMPPSMLKNSVVQ